MALDVTRTFGCKYSMFFCLSGMLVSLHIMTKIIILLGLLKTCTENFWIPKNYFWQKPEMKRENS